MCVKSWPIWENTNITRVTKHLQAWKHSSHWWEKCTDPGQKVTCFFGLKIWELLPPGENNPKQRHSQGTQRKHQSDCGFGGKNVWEKLNMNAWLSTNLIRDQEINLQLFNSQNVNVIGEADFFFFFFNAQRSLFSSGFASEFWKAAGRQWSLLSVPCKRWCQFLIKSEQKQ